MIIYEKHRHIQGQFLNQVKKINYGGGGIFWCVNRLK